MLGIALGRSARTTQETVFCFFFFFFFRRRGVLDRVGPAQALGPALHQRTRLRHIQNGGRAGPVGRFNVSQVASSTPIMAASRPAAAARSGVPETCGLEQILEALKLLLSPGGERTNLGAGLDLRLAGSRARPGCPCMFLSGPPGNSIPLPGAFGLVQSHLKLKETKAPGGPAVR